MKARLLNFKLSDASARRLIADIASKSGNVIYTKHAIKQMRSRKILPTQVLQCIKNGRITESPYLDPYGNWKLTIERYYAGDSVGCAIAVNINMHKVIVITSFKVN